jgi:hypothetical protein
MSRKEIEEILETEIKKIQTEFELVRVPKDDIKRFFLGRPVGEILKSKKINYMGSCLDLTSVLIQRLLEQGINSTLIVHELISEHTRKPVFHFALELHVPDGNITIDFKTGKVALWYNGQYNARRSIPHLISLKINRFEINSLDTAKSLLQNVGIEKPAAYERLFMHVRYCNLIQASRKIIKDDSERGETLLDHVKKNSCKN